MAFSRRRIGNVGWAGHGFTRWTRELAQGQQWALIRRRGNPATDFALPPQRLKTSRGCSAGKLLMSRLAFAR